MNKSIWANINLNNIVECRGPQLDLSEKEEETNT